MRENKNTSTTCEASLGWHNDSFGKPVIRQCYNPASVRVVAKGTSFRAYVCPSCAERMIAAGKVEEER